MDYFAYRHVILPLCILQKSKTNFPLLWMSRRESRLQKKITCRVPVQLVPRRQVEHLSEEDIEQVLMAIREVHDKFPLKIQNRFQRKRVKRISTWTSIPINSMQQRVTLPDVYCQMLILFTVFASLLSFIVQQCTAPTFTIIINAAQTQSCNF